MQKDIPRVKGANIILKAVLLLSVIFFAGVGTVAYTLFSGDAAGQAKDIIIPRGSSIASVSELLNKNEIIGHPLVFKLMLKFSGGSKRVRAGEFRFRPEMGAVKALFVLYHDEPIVHQITIPEGWAIRQIAQVLAAEHLIDENKFVSYALSAEAAKRMHLNAPTLEGFLFPDTYSFSKIDGEERIAQIMVQRFREKFDKPMQARATELGFTLVELTTLASIIEKETGATGERELISSVFHNRLKKRMKLQSDPTTIYGIANFNGNITRKDLLTYTPYNTYTIPALPPGPIASVGAAAIHAALYPATSKYLYFVSNNHGGHIFSETYEQHNRYVNSFQRHPSSVKEKAPWKKLRTKKR